MSKTRGLQAWPAQNLNYFKTLYLGPIEVDHLYMANHVISGLTKVVTQVGDDGVVLVCSRSPHEGVCLLDLFVSGCNKLVCGRLGGLVEVICIGGVESVPSK